MEINETEDLGEITVKRGIDELEVNRKNSKCPNYRSLTAYYYPERGELRIHDFNMNGDALLLFDTDNDGKVEMLFLNFKYYQRRDAPEEFLKADQKLADYKALLNLDAVVSEELKKPAPTLGELLVNFDDL